MDNDDNGNKNDDNYAKERNKEIKRERYTRTPHIACEGGSSHGFWHIQTICEIDTSVSAWMVSDGYKYVVELEIIRYKKRFDEMGPSFIFFALNFGNIYW